MENQRPTVSENKQAFGRCKTCKHWTPFLVKYPERTRVRDDKKAGGICLCEKLAEDWGDPFDADMLVYSYDESGEFWTGPEFGCVHYEPRARVQAADTPRPPARCCIPGCGRESIGPLTLHPGGFGVRRLAMELCEECQLAILDKAIT